MRNKRILALFLTALILIVLMVPSGALASTQVSSIKLNVSSWKTYVGNSGQLKYSVSPASATNKSVTFTSSNPSVAAVSASGIVTPKSVGTAVITCAAVDGSAKATCTVKVYGAGITGAKASRRYINATDWCEVTFQLRTQSASTIAAALVTLNSKGKIDKIFDYQTLKNQMSGTKSITTSVLLLP